MARKRRQAAMGMDGAAGYFICHAGRSIDTGPWISAKEGVLQTLSGLVTVLWTIVLYYEWGTMDGRVVFAGVSAGDQAPRFPLRLCTLPANRGILSSKPSDTAATYDITPDISLLLRHFPNNELQR